MRALSAVLSTPFLPLACTISMVVLPPPLLCRRAGYFPGHLLTAALHALDRLGCFFFDGLVHAICGVSRSILLLRWRYLLCRGMSCLWDWGCRPWQRPCRTVLLIPRHFNIIDARYLTSRRIVWNPGCNIRQEAGTGPKSCSKHWHPVATVQQEAAYGARQEGDMSDVYRSVQKQGGRLPENRPARGALPLRPSKFSSAPAFLHCSWGRHWSLGNGTPDTEIAASGMPAALAVSSTIALYACLCSVLLGSRGLSLRSTICERLRRQD